MAEATTATKGNDGAQGPPGRQSPQVDPSENVKALNEREAKRQDDLREASDRLNATRLEGLRTIIDLNTKCFAELSKAESRRVDEQMALVREYEARLTLAEAKRIDAIRAVDVQAVSVAAQRAADQAQVLSSTVNQSAEALRNLVASTAAAAQSSLTALINALSARITAVEATQYQNQGRSSLADPAMAELLKEVRSLGSSRSTGEGQAGARGDARTTIVAVAVVVGAIISAIVFLTRPSATVTPAALAPIIIEIPGLAPITVPSPQR